jgi:N-acetylneuraminic acid mutarotase
MKSKVMFSLLILAILIVLSWVVGSAINGSLTMSDEITRAPTVVSYQGQVMVAGQPFDGSGYFKFAIVNNAGDITYWSNDGTSTNGTEPNSGVALPVINGLFNVLLGDTSLTNMTQALTASVFSGSERYMRVWFSADSSIYQLLTPDQRIASVPYALQAQESPYSSLPVGSMVMGNIANNTTLIDAGFIYTGRKLFDTWETKVDMPTGRRFLGLASVDGVIYAIGGESDEGVYEKKNEAYDPVTNSWSTKAEMPTARRTFGISVVDGVIYAIGGSGNFIIHDANEAYDPVTNSWSIKAGLPTARSGLVTVEWDGVIYAIGGSTTYGVGSYESKNEAYNPSNNSWSTRAEMPTGRHFMAAGVWDGEAYVIGGYSASNQHETVNEAYNFTTNTWSTKANMPTGRRSLAASVVDGLVYAIGGYSSSTEYEKKNEAYNPLTDSWIEKPDMPTGRKGVSSVAVDGVIYAIGGQTSPSTYDVTANEAYNPALYIYFKH